MGNTKYPYENESVFNSSELPGEEVGEWGGGEGGGGVHVKVLWLVA